ncbi:MAG: hypothetical protein EP345_17650 [Sphingomonadales bacterium]|nr:MAG: hypothetical protein EP345_17650 [Sphingomonadales bacterium]
MFQSLSIGTEEWFTPECKLSLGLESLYFIGAGPFIKIGRSKKPDLRLGTLKSRCPFDIEVIHIWPDMGWQERIWHKAFRHQRQIREWFHRTDDLMAAISAVEMGSEWIATLKAPDHFKAIMKATGNGAVDPDLYWRERISDLEDIELDKILGRKTRPVDSCESRVNWKTDSAPEQVL